MKPPRIHPSACVDDGVTLGRGVEVWHGTHVRVGAHIGTNTRLGKNVYVGAGVSVGVNCKVQNNACLYEGCRLEDGVFVGPGAIVTNDLYPRAVNPDGSLKANADWLRGEVTIQQGASLGAGSIILAGATVGAWAVVGAGAVVKGKVEPHALVVGTPAREIGKVCLCGRRCTETCQTCGWKNS